MCRRGFDTPHTSFTALAFILTGITLVLTLNLRGLTQGSAPANSCRVNPAR